MKLLVIRHAIAIEREDFAREGGENDDLRPLTKEGAKKMRKNAKGLAVWVPRPSVIAMSPLIRAVETAEIVTQVWLDLEQEILEELRPEARPEAFAKWLASREEVRDPDGCIAIVGHEPYLSLLVGWYLFGKTVPAVVLKKGGACLLELPAPLPKGLGKGEVKLLWLNTPSQLRAGR